MTTKATHSVKVGDIFDRDGSFYQVTRTSAKTVTVRPIEADFIGIMDPYGWERGYMPKPDHFTTDCFFTAKQNAEGKRCTVHDYSIARNRPQIDVGAYFEAHLWDGTPSVFDSYS